MNIFQFLDNKSLYYDKIDYDVIASSWKILQKHIDLPYVIHIVGTNGKGTTGRFLASFLVQLGKKTIHYTSPHILEFNERIWIDGENSTDKQLNDAHTKLQKILPKDILDRLTYFEYTTLLALVISNGYDYIILEAGLGGEFDATNVVKNDLSIFTAIGLDHQEFLGNSVKEIATTKMRSCKSRYILAPQSSKEVLDVAKNILKDFTKVRYDFNLKLPKGSENLPKYLQENLRTALSVVRYLGFGIENLKLDRLDGRFEYIAKNIIVDVGHNPIAAKAIYDELEKSDKKIVLIYNSYKDKDYTKVLNILHPILKRVEIIECKDKRIVNKEILEDRLKDLDIEFRDFNIDNMDDNLYLVFGSFLVVENFLKQYKKDDR